MQCSFTLLKSQSHLINYYHQVHIQITLQRQKFSQQRNRETCDRWWPIWWTNTVIPAGLQLTYSYFHYQLNCPLFSGLIIYPRNKIIQICPSQLHRAKSDISKCIVLFQQSKNIQLTMIHDKEKQKIFWEADFVIIFACKITEVIKSIITIVAGWLTD